MGDPYQEAYDRFREHEQRYANTILLLGYGGFFALWGSAADSMPRVWFGVAGGLMATSLLLFVVFELAKTFAGSLALSREGAKGKNGVPLSAADALAMADNWIGRVTKRWIWVFIPAALTGLSAGGILLWFFGVAAMSG